MPARDRKFTGRLYGDLAWLWPIISPPQDYVEETSYFAELIRAHSRPTVRTLLNLGCGGGHHDFGLKKYFEVTGVDLNEAMLKLARDLNPEVAYVQGDMRRVRLGRTFDAVTIFDSINYMLTPGDLGRAFTTASLHLRSGGVLLTYVEETPQGFEQNRTHCSTHTCEGVSVVFLENLFDPDPSDTTYEAIFVYLIRRGRRPRFEVDHHRCGVFPLDTWLGLLAKAGLRTSVLKPKLPREDRRIPILLGIKGPKEA